MMKRPIVSTPYGVRGFENLFTQGIDYLQASEDKDYANKIIDLLKSKEKSIEIANNAYKIGKDNFTKEKFINIIKSEVLKHET